jgi:hypothetical protein
MALVAFYALLAIILVVDDHSSDGTFSSGRSIARSDPQVGVALSGRISLKGRTYP